MKKVLLLFLIISLLLSFFTGCKNNKKVISNFDPESGTLTLSGKGEVCNFYDEKSIGEEPIEKEKIKKVVLEEGITELQSCFNSMDALEEIVFAESLKNISDSFKGSAALSALIVPLSVEIIEDSSFSDSAIANLTFRGAIHLRNGAFDRLNKLKFVHIQKDSICEGVFRDCALEEVVIRRNVQLKESKGGANFSQSASNDFPKAYLYPPTDGEELPWGVGGRYKPIVINNGALWIDYQDVIPERNLPINDYTTDFDEKTGTLSISGKGDIWDFYSEEEESGLPQKEKIKKLVFGEGITGVYQSFHNLPQLKEIEIPITLDVINSSFGKAVSLEKLNLPETVKEIVKSSFSDCHRLKEVQFNGPITLIGSFHDCAVEKVHLPKFSKCEGSFADCNEIKEIAIEANVIVRENSVKIDNGWGEGEGDADDWVVTLSFECPDIKEIPRVYICRPKDTVDLGLKEYYWLYIPEGKSWKNYRSAPMELAVSN